jgi:diacylglycerol kinase family enzyme
VSTGPLGTPRSFAFLVNPAAGGGAAPEAAVPVARLLREAGASVEVTYSPGPLAMAALVDQAVSRGDVVVSVGGDGMVASLAGPVSDRGGVLGLVPAGRGNDFARMLNVPEDHAGQAHLLLTSQPSPVDLVSWAPSEGERRVVAGSVYAGVDARAAEIVHRSHRMPTALQYPVAAVRSLLTYHAGHYRLSVDGVATEHLAATVVVANSRFYGKGMQIAPAAEVTDGLLDIVVIEAASRRTLLRALPTVYSGAHVDRPEVRLYRGRRIEIAGDSRTPIPVGGDGEPLGRLPGLAGAPAVVEVLPGALQMLV